MRYRSTTVAALGVLLLGSSACSGGSDGTATPDTSVTTAAATSVTDSAPPSVSAPTGAATSATTSTTSTAPKASAKPTVSAHPAKAVRTLTVTGTSGATYAVTVWAEDKLASCQDHAYGSRMIAFLTSHPCNDTTRQLLSTQVNGRDVGIALVQTFFTGSSPDNPYDNAAAFKQLVEQNGTGNINDLLRDGYRLGKGPTKIPSPDAFSALNEDAGVVVFDLWYLTGATPSNAPELVAAAQDLFLQTIST